MKRSILTLILLSSIMLWSSFTFNRQIQRMYLNYEESAQTSVGTIDEPTQSNVGTIEEPIQTSLGSIDEPVKTDKLVVYQLMTRLFGNKKTTNKYYGSREENGVGKFADINNLALAEIKKLGITHVWYTGVLEHATMADYTAIDIPNDDPDVVKGRAGSPYAIKDYYDISPDLATDPKNRMKEFEDLVSRTHANGLKVIIDFIPNHVARLYNSDAKPAGTKDFGENDDKTKTFDPQNNFYYLPGQELQVPQNAYGTASFAAFDNKMLESPAKATGNDVFSASPSVNDWYETIKLNYGVDVQNNKKTYFDPIPNTWFKMRDILSYWAKKGVDGFRCDVVEFVPVEFWAWAIPQIKTINPQIVFIAEAYNPDLYRTYIVDGKFDYLYDKVGLYDALRRLMSGTGTTKDITYCWQEQSKGISNHMLRFLENHDEQRLASPQFSGNNLTGIPAMTISATLDRGPAMIYFGQEVGEPGKGNEGFQGEDGRTTIFDYWGVPEHQKWMNNGKFDGGQLSPAQKSLRSFYSRLLNLVTEYKSLANGDFFGLQYVNSEGKSMGYLDEKMYCYLRYNGTSRQLIVVNFNQNKFSKVAIKIPEGAWQMMGLATNKKYKFTDLINDKTMPFSIKASEVMNLENVSSGVKMELPPLGAFIFNIEEE